MSAALTALAVRTLRVQARSRWALWVRLGVATVLFLVLASGHGAMEYSGAPGKVMLSIIAWTAALGITLLGLSWFSSGITEEKEERALGLLRLAGVSPTALLLGKGLARLWDAGLVLALALPPLVLTATLGGAAVPQVGAAAASLAAWLALMACLGLLCSVVAPTGQRAAGLLGALLLAWHALPAAAHGLLSATPLGEPLRLARDALWQVSVFGSLEGVLRTGWSGSAFLVQVAVDLALAALAFALARLLFPRFATDDEPVLTRHGWLARLRGAGTGGGRAPTGLRAVAWLDFRTRCGGWRGVAVRAGLFALLGAGFTVAIDRWSHSATVVFALTLVIAILDVAMLAGRLHAAEWRERTLAGLAGLPFNPEQLFYAKLLPLPLMQAPAAACLLVCLLGSPDLMRGVLRAPGEAFFWTVAATVIFLWQGSLTLSLVLARGAVAAAFGIIIVTYILITMMSFSSNGEVFAVLASLAFLVGAGFMHAWALSRWRARIADG